MRHVLAIDESSSITGVASIELDDDPRALPRVRTARAVRMFPGEPERSLVERLWPILKPYCVPAYELWLEHAPPTATAEANHGKQAAIGFAIGYVAGLCAGPWLVGGGGPVRRAEVSAWRESMLVDSARRGHVLYRPGERRPSPTKTGPRKTGLDHVARSPTGKGFRVIYRCGHHIDAPDYAAVTARPTDCPTCEASGTPVDVVEDVREAWKRIACEYVARHWPEVYEPVVADARSRAKEVGRADHLLVGVADACEAAAIGVHACAR